MKQKFGKNTFVKISDEMPSYMKHFESGINAIVAGTYSQLHGGKKIDSYSLYLVRDSKVVNQCAWYEENQLTELPFQDANKAEEMIEDYNFRT